MVAEEDAILLGYHQLNLECTESGSILFLHKNVLFLKKYFKSIILHLINKVLLFWEASDKKNKILNEVKAFANEKLRYYQKRVHEIMERENNIYFNYENLKRFQRKKQYSLKNFQNYKLLPSSERKNIAKPLTKMFSPIDSPKAFITERSFSQAKEELIENSKNFQREDTIISLTNHNSNYPINDYALKPIKEVQDNFKNLIKKIGKEDTLQKIIKKKQINSMDMCERQMIDKSLIFSERKCYNFLLSKLAPTHYEEINKKIKILERIMKNKNINN